MKDLFYEMDRVQKLCGGKGKGHAIVWDIEKGGRRKGYCYNCSREVVISETDASGEALTVQCTRDKPWKNTSKPEKKTKKTESEDLLAELEEDGLI